MRLILSLVKAAFLFVIFTFFALITAFGLTVAGILYLLFGRKARVRAFRVNVGRPDFGDFSEPRVMKDVTPIHPEGLPSGHSN